MTDATVPDSPARRLLAAAGLTPSEEELVVFEMMYPLLRARADAVYTVAQGYEV
jgi:hypothetical protein